MKRLIIIPLLLLTACGQKAVVEESPVNNTATFTYLVQVDEQVKQQQTLLIEAARNTLLYRLQAMGMPQPIVEISNDSLSVQLSDPEIAQQLTMQLLSTTDVNFMVPTDNEEEAHYTSDAIGMWRTTLLEPTHFGVASVAGTAVTMPITQIGRNVLETMQKQSPNGKIGLFIRGNLMFETLLSTELLQQSTFTIGSIATADLASVFADDFNVSRFVRFEIKES